MTNFIRDAACRGRQPQGVIPLRHVSRPHLVNELLAERYSPRFLVAPGGFGKKTLMGEYADVVFSFRHVFWVSGNSPCFLRDLDAGTMAEDLRHWDSEPLLVVFQDVPCMDEHRAAVFSRLLEELVGRGDEVLCSLTPFADSYGALLPDRVLLTGTRLLATQEERVPRLADEGSAVTDSLAPSSCVPCLLWGDKGQRQLLEGLRRESLPQDLLLVASLTLLLGRGALEDLEQFLEPRRLAEAVEVLAAGYPYTGLSTEDSSFQAAPVEIEEFGRVLSHPLGACCGQARCQSRDGMAALAANLLLERGQPRRAFEIVSRISSQAAIMRWLGENSWQLVREGFAKEFCLVFLRASRRHAAVPPSAGAAAAWSFAAMGDFSEALRLGRNVAASAASDDVSRSMAALLLAVFGEGDQLACADEAIGSVMERSRRQEALGREAPVHPDLMDVMAVRAALQDGPALAVRLFQEQRRRRGASVAAPWPDALFASAALILDALLRGDCPQAEDPDERDAVEDFIQEAVLALDAVCAAELSLGWAHQRVGQLLQQLLASDKFPLGLRPKAATKAALQLAQGEQVQQQGDYRRSCRQMEAERESREVSRPEPFRSSGASRQKTEGPAGGVFPMLRVTLFGSFSVSIGDKRVEERLLNRRKSRTLLAVLVLNHGRELSVDYLAATFWPDTAPSAARKNLYALWSLLRRVLSVEGQCPYLIRSEMSMRVNYELVETDLEPFEELCRQLLFGSGKGTEWEELLSLATGRFGGVLLPAERENALIQDSRRRLHTNITDALVAAWRRLFSSGEPQGALWFAREALRRDQSREDVYLAQMRAQIAAEQRAGALDTFFACRSYLTEQLGIDPSPRLVELYRSIIEEEMVL